METINPNSNNPKIAVVSILKNIVLQLLTFQFLDFSSAPPPSFHFQLLRSQFNRSFCNGPKRKESGKAISLLQGR
jgi:hypothetical protein